MRISDWSSDVCSSDLVSLVEPIEGAARRHAVNRGDHGLPAVHRLGAKSITGVLAVPDVVEFEDRLSRLLRFLDVDAGPPRLPRRGAQDATLDVAGARHPFPPIGRGPLRARVGQSVKK